MVICAADMVECELRRSPGLVERLPCAVAITPRGDGRIDLIGLPKAAIRDLFEQAGLDAKQAKLRSRQVFHWLYHRGVTEFEAMTDIAKTMSPLRTKRFVIGPPEVVDAPHSIAVARHLLLRPADGQNIEKVFLLDTVRG